MRRREFFSLLGGIALARPELRAQQLGHVAHIAFLGVSSPARVNPRQSEQFVT